MDNCISMNLGGSYQYVKKVKKQWRYYPKTLVIEEYYLEIKPGKHEEVKDKIDGTVGLVRGMTPILVSTMIIAKNWSIWPFVFVCLYYPYKTIKDLKSIKKLCNGCGCKKPKFKDYYFKTAFNRIDCSWKNFSFMMLVSIISGGFVYASYLENNLKAMAVFAIFSLSGAFYVALIIFKKNKLKLTKGLADRTLSPGSRERSCNLQPKAPARKP